MTDQGEVPISQVAVGDRVLAYNEATGETGYYTVTAVVAHIDPILLELTIDGEILETRARCPRAHSGQAWTTLVPARPAWLEDA